jgi:hypothetical protein
MRARGAEAVVAAGAVGSKIVERVPAVSCVRMVRAVGGLEDPTRPPQVLSRSGEIADVL